MGLFLDSVAAQKVETINNRKATNETEVAKYLKKWQFMHQRRQSRFIKKT
ncbi:hypothetical protein N8687_00735 [bacterium]|nr:hypothetical protein [bacterium]